MTRDKDGNDYVDHLNLTEHFYHLFYQIFV